MRATAKAHQPEDSSAMTHALEERNEEGTKVVAENSKIDENAKAATKESEEGWMRPMKLMLITYFQKKSNKSVESSESSSRCDGSSDINDTENSEHEEELVKQRKE